MRRTILTVTVVASIIAAVSPVSAESGSEGQPATAAADGATTFLVDTATTSLPVTGYEVVREIGFGWVEVAPSPLSIASPSTAGFAPTLVPNGLLELHADPLESDQWGLENTGQAGGVVDADVDITDAWAITTGAPTETIAIIDSGVDLDHPDLIGQLWTNAAETVNGIDDDGNGYIDDIVGWDMVDDDNDPDDFYGHGTSVATVAAAAVNGVGMAGVAPDVRIMPLRVCPASSCSLSAVVEAIAYALDHGATVINLSLGTHTPYEPLEVAIEAAFEAGVMVIASSGNDGTSNDEWPTYPANIDFPNVIAVGATDRTDFLADFAAGGSNYGTTVDLAAPGKDLPVGVIDGWDTASGTSFAAPMVSGAIALLHSVRPTATVTEFRTLLLSTVDPVDNLIGLVATEGRLNAGAALRAATGPVAVPTAFPNQGTLPFTTELDGSASFDTNGTIVDHTWRFPDGSSATGETVEWTPPTYGFHRVVLDVTDDDGITRSADVDIYANAAPVASASIANPIGWIPHLASLSSITSTDDGGTIVGRSWSAPWSFVSGSTVSFLVPIQGVHEITLEVVDNDGASDTDTVTVYVGKDFVDTRTSIFRTDIAWLSATGITRGCNPPMNDRFCPDDTLTRGELAAFLARYLGLASSPSDFFADDDATTFEGDINALAAAGITRGCNPPLQTSYCPDLDVTREQLAAMLARALDLPATDVDYFTDDDDSIFERDINRLAAAGITSGCNPPANDAFCGPDPVTRGELAAVMRRASS